MLQTEVNIKPNICKLYLRDLLEFLLATITCICYPFIMNITIMFIYFIKFVHTVK